MLTSVPAIATEALTKSYRGCIALAGIDLAVFAGEMFALLGPNGAGKTTLFSILATLREPTGGSCRIFGRDVRAEPDAVRASLGIVFQDPALEARISGQQNLTLIGQLYGASLRESRQRAEEALLEVGLEGAGRRPAGELSGGERRRLELARALLTRPRLIFLDEATVGLDVEARRTFWALIARLRQGGTTIFFTTHYIEEAAVADRIALIDAGRLIAVDTPAALKGRLGGGTVRLKTENDGLALDFLCSRGIDARLHQGMLVAELRHVGRDLLDTLRHMPGQVLELEVEPRSLEDAFVALTGGRREAAACGVKR